jgi:hypothetical protein
MFKWVAIILGILVVGNLLTGNLALGGCEKTGTEVLPGVRLTDQEMETWRDCMGRSGYQTDRQALHADRLNRAYCVDVARGVIQ